MTGKGSSLATGAYLVTNDYLTSPDGRYFAILQSDGNFVIYRGNGPTNQGAFVWNSGVAPGGDPHFVAIMQRNGNLVVYRGTDPAHPGAFVWSSRVGPGPGQYVATVQNDGHLVITNASTKPPTVVWTTQPRTIRNRGSGLATGAYLVTNDYLVSADGRYFAILQSDGNFVIYRGNGPTNQGAFVWNSGVAPGGDQHFVAIMQSDGNLVVYRGSDPMHPGAFVWNSGVAPGARGAPQYVATLQNDGNLVITMGAAKPPPVVWSAQPLPSIALTITNQMIEPLTVSIPGFKRTEVTLSSGQSGSLPLRLNTTTAVEYHYAHAYADDRIGVVIEQRITRRFYTVATEDTTLTVTMIVAGGATGYSKSNPTIGAFPTFTETLPSGVTASWSNPG